MFFNMPFILASKSASRSRMLKDSGTVFYQKKPKINETKTKNKKTNKRLKTKEMTLVLAKSKAKSIKKKNILIVGADTAINLNGKTINKAKTTKEAIRKIQKMSGKTHEIYSTAVAYYNNKLVWKKTQKAKITIRKLSEKEIKNYLKKCGKQILNSVGCYQLEKKGPSIIEKVKGDFFCVMGLPLLPFLVFLKKFKIKR